MTKKNDDYDFNDRLNKLFTTKEMKNSMIATSMGMSAVMCSYIVESMNIRDIPVDVRYAVAMTSGNMLAIMTADEVAVPVDLTENMEDINEQTEESIYRKFVKVVKMIHADILEKEKEDLL